MPSTDANLIALYGLEQLSKSVARSNPDGTKGVKLRKSYKNHIADLPGKHVIPKDRNLSFVAFRPREPGSQINIKPFDELYLRQCLNLDKTTGPIAGFPLAKLGMLEDSTSATSPKRQRPEDPASMRKKPKF